MSYTIRSNRSTNHIEGIGAKTTGDGASEAQNSERGYVAYYAENACGTLTRSALRMSRDKSFESLADALANARIAGGRNICKVCERAAVAQLEAESAIIEPSTTDQSNTDQGETEMAAKTTETTTPAVDVEKVTEEVAATVERLTAVAIAGEDVEPLKAEAEALILTLPAKERTKLRAQVRKAADTKPADVAKIHEGTVFHSTEVGTIDTTDYTADAETVDLRDAVAEKMVSGIRTQMKAVDVAREATRAMITLRTHIIHKGAPDLRCQSDQGRKAAQDAYDKVMEAFPELDEKARIAERDKFKKSVNNVMQEEIILWTRRIEPGSAEAKRFAKVIGDATDPGAAIRKAYGFPEMTLLEKRKADRALAAGSADSEGDSEGGEGDNEGGDTDTGVTVEKPKDFDLIGKIEKSLGKVAKTPAEYEDGDLDALIEEASDLGTLVSDLIARLRAEKKRRKEDGE